MSEGAYGAVVIGGGVVGLAAAWHLLELGCRPVAVVERSQVAHPGGSSHGGVRMTRSTYASAAYAALMRHVHTEEWPRLERAAGTTLVRPGPIVFFGPDRATLGGYAAAVQAAGADVERLAPAEGRRRFPGLRIGDDAEVLHDRTGGIIAAAETVRALHRLVGEGGGALMEGTRVLAIERDTPLIRVVSERGVLLAERVVIATGPWLRDLVPVLASRVTVVPQTVAYFPLGTPVGPLLGWIHFGGAENGIAYGLPERGDTTLKVGFHVTRGPGADPDAPAPLAPREREALRARLTHVLAGPVGEPLAAERCLYTMTPDEGFVIDRWPGDPRVAFAAACSGHGFKFAPLTGRVLAELVVRGTAELPGGGDARTMFGLGAETA